MIVVQDAPKSKRMLHCFVEMLQLLKSRLFVSGLLEEGCTVFFNRSRRSLGI